MMLELEAGRKVYGQTVAVDDVDLRVAPGRTTVLIGPSGCGKSTILRLLLGLIAPTSGLVRFDGREVTLEDAPALRRRMGYVIQGGGLFPHLTARENVTLMAGRLGWSGQQQDARLGELAALTRTPAHLWDLYPLQLSGGERQRVALMRALMLDPEVLLLDEPLGALDPMVRAELQGDLADAFRELEKTVVLVTHDMNEAAFLGNEIVLLRDGRTVASGSFADLRNSDVDFVRQFIEAQRGVLSP
ncbi:MAG: osmoprotectant transport system ATP-binding protein [Planctomycetota bacterium]|jgi:osmoprotectant transport system ATP-binding protein